MRLVAFDIESTGVDPYQDRIVELTLMRFEPVEPRESNGWRRFEVQASYTSRYHPGRKIPEAATAAHGITDADVAEAPPFGQDAEFVQAFIKGAVLVGYNSRSFDTPLLDSELRRNGQPGIDLATVQEIDVFRLWNALEPRTLTGALWRFRKERLENAHQAEADTDATIRVLDGMFSGENISLADAIRLSKPEGEVDRGGKLAVDEDGDLVFAFGKHRGDKCRDQVDYIRWMAGSGFPEETMNVLRAWARNGWKAPE